MKKLIVSLMAVGFLMAPVGAFAKENNHHNNTPVSNHNTNVSIVTNVNGGKEGKTGNVTVTNTVIVNYGTIILNIGGTNHGHGNN